METSNWDGPVAEMRNQSSAPLERIVFPAPDESGDWTGPAGETNHVRVPYVSAKKKKNINVVKTIFTPMTGNGNHTTDKHGDLGDDLLLF